MKLPAFSTATIDPDSGERAGSLSQPLTGTSTTIVGPFVASDSVFNSIRQESFSSSAYSDDTPSVADSDVSSIASFVEAAAAVGDVFLENHHVPSPTTVPPPSSCLPRTPLQWVFKGLTLWLEFDEYDNDLTRAIDFAARVYGTGRIPVAHATAIYGMTHLSQEEAIAKLEQLIPSKRLSHWPQLEAPRGLTCDTAQEGRPGQVCTIAWTELSFPTNADHEAALDALHQHFEVPEPRQHPWTPHISLAYDNPEDSVLSLHDTYAYVKQHPSLLRCRNVKAISLWNTQGKMAEWQCLHRVAFPSSSSSSSSNGSEDGNDVSNSDV